MMERSRHPRLSTTFGTASIPPCPSAQHWQHWQHWCLSPCGGTTACGAVRYGAPCYFATTSVSVTLRRVVGVEFIFLRRRRVGVLAVEAVRVAVAAATAGHGHWTVDYAFTGAGSGPLSIVHCPSSVVPCLLLARPPAAGGAPAALWSEPWHPLLWFALRCIRGYHDIREPSTT